MAAVVGVRALTDTQGSVVLTYGVPFSARRVYSLSILDYDDPTPANPCTHTAARLANERRRAVCTTAPRRLRME